MEVCEINPKLLLLSDSHGRHAISLDGNVGGKSTSNADLICERALGAFDYDDGENYGFQASKG